MYYVTGSPVISGDIIWQVGHSNVRNDDPGVRVAVTLVSMSDRFQRRQALKAVENALQRDGVNWIVPGPEKWTFNLDALRENFKPLKECDWLTGKLDLAPEVETREREVFGNTHYDADVAFYIMKDELMYHRGQAEQMREPVELRDSLARFRADHPAPSQVAFIIMRFGKTSAHDGLAEAVKRTLKNFDIIGLRADDIFSRM